MRKEWTTNSGIKAIEWIQGDLTRETTDAIVNAANSELLAGGGVCGAIFRAAGAMLDRECALVRRGLDRGEVPTGQAVITPGGNLPAPWVIHTVGPIWEGGEYNEPQLLADCHRHSIELADQHQLKSLSFPAISTGIYGYPIELAAPIALNTTRECLLNAKSVFLVRFVLFGQAAFDVFDQVASKW